MTKEYAKTYCHSMSKSLNDKLFFLKEIDINSYDVIVDFGCADGALLEALCDKSILSNENTKLIGIEKSSTLTELCRARLGDKVLIASSVYDVEDWLKKSKNTLAIFSSVLHECFSQEQFDVDGFDYLESMANTIAIRDMRAPMIKGPIDGTTRARLIKTLSVEDVMRFEGQYGRIDNITNLYRFFLMYKWTDNWEHELKEDYFSIPWSRIKESMANYGYHVIYEKDYILPYLKKEIAAKFQHNLRQPTHKQIIFDRN